MYYYIEVSADDENIIVCLEEFFDGTGRVELNRLVRKKNFLDSLPTNN